MKDYLADAKAWVAKNEDIEAETIEYSIEQLAHKLKRCPDLDQSVKANIRATITYLNQELGLDCEGDNKVNGLESPVNSVGIDTTPLVDLDITPAQLTQEDRREALCALLSTGLIRKGVQY